MYVAREADTCADSCANKYATMSICPLNNLLNTKLFETRARATIKLTKSEISNFVFSLSGKNRTRVR